ncbi:MAG: hypothetical protein JSV91_12320 [Phycisphaerales bacterium]|nr:MAG: hypothetical protein JSV91_12320 [Phycisphaerales bacterium]
MSLKLGAIAFPLFVLIMAAKQKGPVKKFLKAGAISPDTARKLASVEVKGPYYISGALKRGVIVATGDGRYYLDLPVYRRRRTRLLIVLVLIAVAIVAGGLALWPPWN